MSPQILTLFAIGVAYGSAASTENLGVELSNGVVSYLDAHGERVKINVGSECADLWVAPDGNAFAFITIEHSDPPDFPGDKPFIRSSAVYVATRSDGFLPHRQPIGPVRAYGHDWTIFRGPELLPDGVHLVFSVPVASASSGVLYVFDSKTGGTKEIGEAAASCAVWGGEKPGLILSQYRRIEANQFRFRCIVSTSNGLDVSRQEGCDDFGDFVSSWVRLNGGKCL